MREIKFRFFYKNKCIEDALSLKEVGDRSSFHWADDVIVAQYTGLKDKNGKEIYEGDIFRQKGMECELILGTIVFYDDLSYRCREGDYIYHKVKFAGEVIGNIYENSELIK